MATNIQRAQSYVDALLNRSATANEVNRIGTALARHAGKYAEYQAASQDGKAGILIACARLNDINIVKSTEAQAAAQAAANNAVLNVDSDFQETL